MNHAVAVVGLGEVGKPLLELARTRHEALGVDLDSPVVNDTVNVLHICYPFEISDFVGETTRYIERLQPGLTIINSTVAVGTTRTIANRTGAVVVHSPIRGKHARMLEELRLYTKFIGAMDPGAGKAAADHFQALGLKTAILSSPECTELAKLTETTYLGVLIAWAQEIERYCGLMGGQYDEIVSFFDEIRYLPPVKYWPGVIGGHCVMPNIEILSNFEQSPLLDAIRLVNRLKIERETHASAALSGVSE